MSHKTAVLYIRELPGGGFVSIEGRTPGNGTPCQGALFVERRSDPERRIGHEPPAVIETAGDSQSAVFTELVEVANSNVAIAAALLRWQAGRGRGLELRE